MAGMTLAMVFLKRSYLQAIPQDPSSTRLSRSMRSQMHRCQEQIILVMIALNDKECLQVVSLLCSP